VKLGHTLREEHRLRTSDSKVCRRINGLKRNAVGGWRKIHSEKLHNFYFSSDIYSTIKMDGIRSTQEDEETHKKD
jgi:hypothetical protein